MPTNAASNARPAPIARAIAVIADTQGGQSNKKTEKAIALSASNGNPPQKSANVPAMFSFAIKPEKAA